MKNSFALSTIILSAVLLRLIPHMPNFAPVGAMALFGGTYLRRKYAVGIIFSVLFVSDYLLLYIHPFSSQLVTFSHLYPISSLSHSTTIYVYGSFLLTVTIGMWLKKHQSIENIVLASLISSLVFFLITNFGVWASGMYSRSFTGLCESYFMGLPFFRGTVFGDLFYTGLFFGGYEVVMQIKYKKLNSKNTNQI